MSRRKIWIVIAGIIGGLFALYIAVVVAVKSIPQHRNGQHVRLEKAIQLPDSAEGLAVAEKASTMTVFTANAVSCYRYPTLEHLRTRPRDDFKLVGVISGAIVVTNSQDEVVLLSPETLTPLYTDTLPSHTVAVNYELSAVIIVQRAGAARILRLSPDGVISTERKLPFSAYSMTALAMLNTGDLLISTNEKNRFYRLAPPYNDPVEIVGNDDRLHCIRQYSGQTHFLTLEIGAIRVWDEKTLKPIVNVWVSCAASSKERMVRLKIEDARGRSDIRKIYPNTGIPLVHAQYCAKRRLLAISDPFAIPRQILFLNSDTISIVDKIVTNFGSPDRTYLSDDGSRLIVAVGKRLQCWFIPELPEE